MPIMPASPTGATSEGVTMGLIVPLVSRSFTGPGRSVKNIRPSGRNDMSHGLLSPVTKSVRVIAGEFAGGPWSGGGGGSSDGGGGGLGGAHAAAIDPRQTPASAAATLCPMRTAVPSALGSRRP